MHIPSPDPAASLLDALRTLRAQAQLTPTEAEHLARQAAALFREHYTKAQAYLPDAITLLAELATDPDPALSQVGTAHLFPELVEWSADWFNPDYCRLYDRLFAQVIDVCRRLPGCREMNFTLHGYGLPDTDAFLARREALQAPRPRIHPEAERVAKALFLSRVTFGAEVAVTSVALGAVRQLFPDAELVLLGAPAAGQLFAGLPNFRVQDAHYPRGGALLDRLNSWPRLTQTVADELAGLDANEYLVIDPDSRLTQLGLLPVTTNKSRYLFFESRSYGSADEAAPEGDAGVPPGDAPAATISRLTARWLAECFHGLDADQLLPFVHLAAKHTALRDALRDRRPLACVSFGVGGNDRKRVGERFERALLATLLDARARVLLVKGVGAEVARTAAHLEALRAQGAEVIEVSANTAADLPAPARLRRANVIAWEGELGAFCAVIAAAHVYIGYDSGGSHIAAAQGVPVIDIFADDSIPMVATRWTPTGPAPVHVIRHYEAPTETLDRALAAYWDAVAFGGRGSS
ncbi:MAG: hypothetical protein Kow00120_11700 [Anaerolineae bacterium]